MKARIKETGEVIDVWKVMDGVWKPTGFYTDKYGWPVEFSADDLDFNPYNDKRVDVINNIIDELKNIRYKYVHGQEVDNDDWAKPAALLRDNMPLFMYNNPESEEKE